MCIWVSTIYYRCSLTCNIFRQEKNSCKPIWLAKLCTNIFLNFVPAKSLVRAAIQGTCYFSVVLKVWKGIAFSQKGFRGKVDKNPKKQPFWKLLRKSCLWLNSRKHDMISRKSGHFGLFLSVFPLNKEEKWMKNRRSCPFGQKTTFNSEIRASENWARQGPPVLWVGCLVWVHLLSLEMVKRISIVAIEGKISLLLCPDFRKQVTASTATATSSLTFIPLGCVVLYSLWSISEGVNRYQLRSKFTNCNVYLTWSWNALTLDKTRNKAKINGVGLNFLVF